ncbi:Flp family type IVb pilin [Vibrio japonicus]|uniref:Flp family type IVb pilin n=1 Tax=Vibrio japonicus TaxID=1824638 RepID=A0ABY5LH19_9VIBR|nr:Flp family type IVb pilin [Vibrio japonicus]UUM30083.1 Flp family type IVb pilin [Vibrio japonicus]
MDKFTKVVKEFWNDEEGLTAVEYAVAGGLIAVGIATAFGDLGDEVDRVIGLITGDLEGVN